MTSSGRCHGPGCRETAVVDGGFCGERCQERWHGQFDTVTERPVTVRLATWTDPATIERLRVQLADLAGSEPRFEELPPALDGDSEERTCRALTAPVATIDTIRRDEDGLHVTGRWLPLPADPTRGWLSRWFDRLFGRTT